MPVFSTLSEMYCRVDASGARRSKFRNELSRRMQRFSSINTIVSGKENPNRTAVFMDKSLGGVFSQLAMNMSTIVVVWWGDKRIDADAE